MSQWELIADIYGIILIAICLHIFTMAIAGWLAGTGIAEIAIGIGPKVIGANTSLGRLQIRLFPIYGSVRFHSQEHTDAHGFHPAPAPSRPAFEELHPLKRALVAASGIVILALCAGLILRTEVISAMTAMWGQFFGIWFAPATHAAAMLEAMKETIATRPYLEVLALGLAKLASLNAIPLPLFNGGDVIANLIAWWTGWTPNYEKLQSLLWLTFIIFGGALLLWIYGVFVWFFF